MRLNPHYSFMYLFFLGKAYYLTRRYEEATAELKRAVAREPNFVPPHSYLAAIYSISGRMEEARSEIAEMLRIEPHKNLEDQKRKMRWKDQAATDRHLDALRKAGLPEKSRSTAP